jgi:hypothetical protein
MRYLFSVALGFLLLLICPEKGLLNYDKVNGDEELFPLMSSTIQGRCCNNSFGINPYPVIRYFEKDTSILSGGLSSDLLHRYKLGLVNMMYSDEQFYVERDSLWFNCYFEKEIRDSIRIKKYKKMRVGLGVFDQFTLPTNSCYLRKEGRNVFLYHSSILDSDGSGYDQLLFFFSSPSPILKWKVSGFPMGDGFGEHGYDIFTVSLEQKVYFPSIQDTLFSFKFKADHECFSPTMLYVSEKYGIVGFSIFHCHATRDPRYVGDCETWYYPYQ